MRNRDVQKNKEDAKRDEIINKNVNGMTELNKKKNKTYF